MSEYFLKGLSETMSNVLPLNPYEVHEFEWGSAIKKRNGDWERVYLKPDAQEINVMNLHVILHDNGIEFCGIKE